MKVTPGINRAKTWVLIAGLLGLFLVIGYLIGGREGATIALVLGLGFNFAMYCDPLDPVSRGERGGIPAAVSHRA